MIVLNMRRKQLRLFWVCAKTKQICLSMRWKKLCLVWICAERNYSMFALSMRGTNDTFTENARNVIDMLHKICIERYLPHTEYTQNDIVLMLSTVWVYGERCFIRKIRFSLFWVCAGIDCSFHTTERILFKKNCKDKK